MIRPVQKDLYAVIGNPAAHSLSPLMMNAVFETFKIPAVYLAFQVDDPAEDLGMLSRLGVKGLSVTIPHKEAAYRLAKHVDEASQAMGAVNTLRLDGTRWEGRNTDWIGAIAALRQKMDPSETRHQAETCHPNDEDALSRVNGPARHPALNTQPFLEGKRALVLGAGGVARAVVYGLKREEAAVAISNRGLERGETLAGFFNCDFIPLAELSGTGSKAAFDIIVQCTSVGLMGKEDFTLFPDALFRPGTVVLDTVYRPLWTPFLRRAKAAGCIVVSGVEMLLHQGAAQLEWWLGETIRPEVVVPVMRKALMRSLEDE
jgi:shikimate dehydrogenase